MVVSDDGRTTALHIAPASYSLAVLLKRRIQLFGEYGVDSTGFSTSAGFSFDAKSELNEVSAEYIESQWLTRELSPLSDLRFCLEVFRLVRRSRPDVVLTYGPKPGYFGRIGARLAGALVVHTYWGMPYSDRDNGIKRLVLQSLDVLSAGFAHRTLAVNRALVEQVSGYPTVRRHTVTFIGNGTDIDDAFDPKKLDVEAVARLRKDARTGERIVILMVGRKVRDKGYPEFLEAAQALVDKGLPIQFWVAGATDNARNEGAVEDASSALRDRGVLVDLGEVPHEAMPSTLAAADIVCLPTYREGFPRALVEAAAVGRALVATDIAGCREIVRPGINGTLVPVGNAAALAAALEALASDPTRRRRYGLASRAIAEAELDERKLVETMIAAISAVPTKPRWGRGADAAD